MKRVISKIKEYGILLTIIKIFKRINMKVGNLLEKFEKKYKLHSGEYKELKKLCEDRKYKTVFIFHPFVIWNLPAFQRPQQIALALSKKKDVLYVYCTPDGAADGLNGVYKKISDNLILTNDYDFVSQLKIKNKVSQFYSTDILTDYSVIKKAMKNGNKILYEYIDGIDEKLLGDIPQSYLDRHNGILKDESNYVLASASNLLEDIKKVRTKNYAFICNGVTLSDFRSNSKQIPKEIEKIKKEYDKIVCYYGALASWFDYELLKKCAKKYPKYAFILIGIDYDKTLGKSGVDKYKNIMYLGKVNYKELINYTKNVDLLTIPFVINNITKSTSPVKLFEYMATQKPILTTAMPECKKYKSAIIGKDHDDYIKKIDETLKLSKNKEYLATEMKEAKENTWDSKADDILKLVNEEM